MSYKALYAYAWDVADATVPEFVAELRDLGLDTVTLAGSYHAGKFLRPRARNKVYFPEDGTAYFRPDPKRYGAIKPLPSAVTVEADVLRELSETGRIATNVWLVLMHNTRLGSLHPDCCVTNAFGDRYIYNLCPSAPAAREYAVALCADVTQNYAVMGLSLETPGFMPYHHGFHHEFAFIKWNRWLESLLGLCFCGHCLAGAAAAGIDAEELRRTVRGDIESYLASDFELADDMADAIWFADTRSAGPLGPFLRWRTEIVTSLIRDIRAAVRSDAAIAVIPTVARPTGGAWYEGSDLGALGAAAGIVEAAFYENSAARIASDVWDVQRRLRGVGRLRGILRPAHPDFASGETVAAAVAALRRGGVDDIAFYNYGHLRGQSLRWIGEALAGSRSRAP
jgi:hypothetical protein